MGTPGSKPGPKTLIAVGWSLDVTIGVLNTLPQPAFYLIAHSPRLNVPVRFAYASFEGLADPPNGLSFPGKTLLR